MENTVKIIDIATWPRRQHYEFFRKLDYPHFSITGTVDISRLLPIIKKQKRPLFKTLLYCALRTANQIPEFRTRIRTDTVLIHDRINPRFTSRTGDDLFSFCTATYEEKIEDFYDSVTRSMAGVAKTVCLQEEPDRDDFLFVTSIPWISFTGIVHPVHMSPVDSIPRVTFGKYTNEQTGVIKLPLAVQGHHSLIDGRHMGEFFNGFQDEVDTLFLSFSETD